MNHFLLHWVSNAKRYVVWKSLSSKPPCIKLRRRGFVWHQKQFSPSCECLQNQLKPWACSGIGAEGWSREKSVMTIIIRRRVMRVDLDERSNILGGLFNPPSAESTPRAANTRTLPLFRHQFSNVWLFCPIFFHCVTVLPQFVNDLSSRLPHPPGLLVGQLTPSTLAHCYAIFHCWLKSKYQWQRSSSWAIGWPPPYSKFSIFNIGKFNSFTIGWRGQRTALLRPFLSTLSHFQAPYPTFVTAFCDTFTLQCPHLWQLCPVPTINWQVCILFSTIFNACACVVCSGNIESFSYSLNLSFAQLYIV